MTDIDTIGRDRWNMLDNGPSAQLSRPGIAAAGGRDARFLRARGECPVPPSADHVTNPRLIFLREIGKECLKPFLEAVIAANVEGNVNYAHWGSTLVIDEIVELGTPLTIPAHFTLAGVGINGGGRLHFKDLGGQPALRTQDVDSAVLTGYSAIRDLAVEGVGGGVDAGGLFVDNAGGAGNCFLDNVMIRGFSHYGVRGGTDNYSVHLRDCIIESNGTNILLGLRCNGWRLTDCTIRGASTWGLRVAEALNDLVVTGCRVEDNALGGVRVEGFNPNIPGDYTFGVMLVGNCFSRNNGKGISVDSLSASDEKRVQSTRIAGNVLLDGDRLDDPWLTQNLLAEQGSTQIGFNASSFVPPKITDPNDERIFAFMG